MAVVSVDIELMSRLVAELAAAEEAMTRAAGSLRADLASVGLSCDLLPRFLVGGYSVGEVRQIRLQCQQRLDRAIAIRDARSWLGWWGGNPVLPSVVTFDESVMSGENASRAAEFVDAMVRGRIHVEDGLPLELSDLLLAGAADPDFAVAFAGLVPPATLADFLNRVDVQLGNLGSSRTSETLAFRDRYASLLDRFGSVYSLAAVAIPDGSAEQQASVGRWHDVFAYHVPGSPSQALLSMVVARGRWPDVYLTGMKTGIENAEGHMGARGWGVCWGTTSDPRTIIDPGRSMEDGSPVEVNDPMYGVWSAAAYNPQWFLDTYQGSDLVDVVYGRAGYYGSEFMDGSDFDHMIPTHADVDSGLQELFTKRGFDQGSLNAFLMAASIANTWQSLTTGTATVGLQVDQMLRVLDFNMAEWASLPWLDKHKHEILAAFSAVAGIAAMFVPGPGWIAGGLLLASVAAGAADVGLYIAEGEYWSAAITGVLLLPIAIGGSMRLIQLSRTEWQALKSGQIITKGGQNIGVVQGKVTQVSAPTGTPPASPPPAPPTTAPVFRSDIADHMANVDRITTNDGVVGGHNLGNFEQAFRDLGVNPTDAILSKTQIYPGVYEIHYQVPLRVPGGAVRQPLTWKSPGPPKTVYDPAVYSDAQMLQWGREAMMNAKPVTGKPGLHEGVASNGMKFRARDDNGIYMNLYPVK